MRGHGRHGARRPGARGRSLDLSGLNPAQYEAVTLPAGPVLVIAGAGSGKTRVLTHRLAYLVAELGASPFEILAITFTNKAAGEMRERVAAARRSGRAPHVGVDLPRRVLAHPAPGGVAARLPVELHDLRPGRRHAPHRLGAARPQPRSEAVPGPAAARADQRAEERADPARASTRSRPSARPSGASPRCTPSTSGGWPRRRPSTSTTCSCSRCGCSASTPKRCTATSSGSGTCSSTSSRTRTPRSGSSCACSRVEHRSIMVVGDDAQSVYKFRGADFRNLLQFEDAFPDATIVVLDQNYRSTQRILEAANAVIANNASTRKKHLWTDKGAGRADRPLPGRRRARRGRVRRARDPSPRRRRPSTATATSPSSTARTRRAACSKSRSCARACRTACSAA